MRLKENFWRCVQSPPINGLRGRAGGRSIPTPSCFGLGFSFTLSEEESMAQASAKHFPEARPEERFHRWPDPEENGQSLRASGEVAARPLSPPARMGACRPTKEKRSLRGPGLGTPSPTSAALWDGRAPRAACVSRKPGVASPAGWGAPRPNSRQVEGTAGLEEALSPPVQGALTCALCPPVHPQPSQRLSLGPGPPHQPVALENSPQSPIPSIRLPPPVFGGLWGGGCTAEGGWRWAQLPVACTSSSTHSLLPGEELAWG